MLDMWKTKDDEKVRDHCHITGKYGGAAHWSCNVNLKLTKNIFITFHNFNIFNNFNNFNNFNISKRLWQSFNHKCN